MSAAAIAKALALTGATPEQIVAAIEAYEQPEMERRALKREADRQRKIRQREKENADKSTLVSRGQSVTVCDISSPPDSPPLSSPVPPTNTPPLTPPSLTDDSSACADVDVKDLIEQIDEIVHPSIITNTSRLPVWLANGATSALILDTIKRVMAKRGEGRKPPNTLAYFEQAISEAIAAAQAPMVISAPSGKGKAQAVAKHNTPTSADAIELAQKLTPEQQAEKRAWYRRFGQHHPLFNPNSETERCA